jgi:hypothetical protein
MTFGEISVGIFNGAVSSWTLHRRIVGKQMNVKFKRIWKKAVVAHYDRPNYMVLK